MQQRLPVLPKQQNPHKLEFPVCEDFVVFYNEPAMVLYLVSAYYRFH